MEISAEKIEENRNWILESIEKHISSPRKEKLLELYQTYDERLTLMPASLKTEFHNCFVGGYYDHVRRVIECSFKINEVWKSMGVDSSTYTDEELFFSALNHDLGKLGDEQHESYIPQDNQWRKDTLGELYKFNTNLAFVSVPDRSLFILQSNNIPYSLNEMLAIQTHDGMYDESNKKYFAPFRPETKFRTSLPYILHQADLMAARIEFEREWLPQLGKEENSVEEGKKGNTVKKKKTSASKALGEITNPNLKTIFDNL